MHFIASDNYKDITLDVTVKLAYYKYSVFTTRCAKVQGEVTVGELNGHGTVL